MAVTALGTTEVIRPSVRKRKLEDERRVAAQKFSERVDWRLGPSRIAENLARCK